MNKKILARIKRLKKRRKRLEIEKEERLASIESSIYKINQKLFKLILKRK